MKPAAPVLILLAMLASAGCSMAFTFGYRPQLDQLTKLTRGTSTEADIEKTLGPPRGAGSAHFAVGAAQVLFYDAGEGDSDSLRNRLLLVFVRDGRYDGYLWYDADVPMRKE